MCRDLSQRLIKTATDGVTQVVYLQPLWLEVIDFLWEGVLGAAVWGGSAEPATPSAVVSGESLTRFFLLR